MKSKPFVHLHLHTGYSLLDGLCRPADIMEFCIQNNMSAVAITDHGVLYGLVEFYKEANKAGVKPILGCEAYITHGKLSESDKLRGSLPHLVLLAADSKGYQNLIELNTTAHLEGFYYKPRIDKEILATHREGLLGLSACLKGEVAQALLEDDMAQAVKLAGTYQDIFGKGNFFLEIHNHGLKEEKQLIPKLKEVSNRTGIPLVATNDVHYLRKSDAEVQEIALCLQTQTVISNNNRMRYDTSEMYLKTYEEMQLAFKDFPEAVKRTVDIAERCNVEIEFGRPHFPTYRTPENILQVEYLRILGLKGLQEKYNIHDVKNPKTAQEKEIISRFEYEMKVIEKTGYVNYYLVVWDFVQYARSRHIPVWLRGSGGASIVAYAIGITEIDPIKYDLVFERFLNPERVSPPDFDLDFCQVRREEMINYVKQKYGESHVAQIITFNTLRARQIIRDIGRVLEVPLKECDRLAKLIPDEPKMTLSAALDRSPEFKEAYNTNSIYKKIVTYGFVIEGLPRNVGTHAAGIVMCERPIRKIIPLIRDKDGHLVTQYNMEILSELGLMKMDFLGLRTLTVMQHTIDMVKQTKGIEIVLSSLPLDDKATFSLLNRGETVGVFQLESDGMKNLIRQVGVNNIEELIAIIALYRPGPMNMLDEYIQRKTGKTKIKYDHPLLAPILKETYGVMIYQEHVQKVAHELAGFSLGAGDILRRAMSKKKKEEMEEQRQLFVDGCVKKRRMSRATAENIFNNIARFAEYGFNKAHSVAYAIMAYRTAYLKANYPTEFMAALMSSEMGDIKKTPVLVTEALHMGLKVLPPDINSSYVEFTAHDSTIRFGLASIKNVGYGAAETITLEREKNGPFKGLIDFCFRMKDSQLNRKVVESLIKCGAFDTLETNRAKLFYGLDIALNYAASLARDMYSGQQNLFGDFSASNHLVNLDKNLPDYEPWQQNEKLKYERELLGIFIGGHPIMGYTVVLKKCQMDSISSLEELSDRTPVVVGGIVVDIDRKNTMKNTVWAILQLEGLDGNIPVVLYTRVYENHKSILDKMVNSPVVVWGQLVRNDDNTSPKIIAERILPMDEALQWSTECISIHLRIAHINDSLLEQLKNILKLHHGSIPVRLCLIAPNNDKIFVSIDPSFYVKPLHVFFEEVEKLLGEDTVFVLLKSGLMKNKASNNS